MFSFLKLIRIAFILIAIFFFTKKKNRGRKITKSLEKLGPSFIKLGQTLSVRPDIVGEDIAEELSNLQDKLPPFDYKKAKNILEKELGQKIEKLFTSFENESIAAASIAQVHRAKTLDGDDVAVKILRPKIERSFKSDLKLLYFIARFLDNFTYLKRLKLIEIVDLFKNTVKKELDLRIEAASASQLKENCKDDEGIYIPNVMWDLTTRSVLTTEWINGIPINQTKLLTDAGHNLEEIAKKLAISFFNQTYRDGFFHADIHPGNLFVNDAGDIVPVDFGIMGRLDQATRIYVAEILRGFIQGDYEHVARVHFEAGYVPGDKSVGDFAIAARAIGEPIMGQPVNKISIAKLLALLFKITEDFEMETQPQLLLLQKTMVLVEGVGQDLHPDVNLWKLAEPWIEKWAKKNLGTEAKIKAAMHEASYMVQNLPLKLKKIEEIIDNYHKDGITLHPDTVMALKKKDKGTLYPILIIITLILTYIGINL